MGSVPNGFFRDVLVQIRAPVTALNLQSFQTWRRFEGGTALWNPLNTEERRPGSSNYNSAGVQNYPNEASGINATVDTLTNGRYTAILVRLRNNMPLPEWNDPSVIEQLNTWGTHGFAAYIQTLAPPPQPQAIEEEDMIIVQATGQASEYLLIGDKLIGIPGPPDAAALQAAGVKHAEITPAFLTNIANAIKETPA